MSRFGTRTRMLGSSASDLVGSWLQSSPIKSIQRGVITIAAGATSNTATLSPAVVTGNCRIVWLGTLAASDANGPSVNACRVELTSTTVVTAYVNSTGAAGRDVGFEVIEYWPGVIRTVQRSTLATAGATSGTAAITAVTLAKSTLDNLGFTSTSVTESAMGNTFKLILTSSTLITGDGINALTRTCGYQVIEWT